MSGCWYDFSPLSAKYSGRLSLQALPFFAHHLLLHLCSHAACVWLFIIIFLNGQITCRLSGPSCPPLVQWHPYPLVPHDLSHPSIPTLQSHMLSFSPASLPSSPSCPLHNPSIPNLQSFMPFFMYTSLLSGHSCPPSAQHPYPPVTHEMPSLSPSIPTLQSLAAYFNPAFPELCNPTLRSLLPSLSPACSLKLL